MKLKILKKEDILNKVVIYRAPFDVPLEFSALGVKVKNNDRILACTESLEFLKKYAKGVIVLAKIGRPKDKDLRYSTEVLVKELKEIVGKNVFYKNSFDKSEIEKFLSSKPDGSFLVLENLRFYSEEKENSLDFAKKLASLGEVVVFDAFTEAHRETASTSALLNLLPIVAGYYLQSEVENLSKLLHKPKKPVVLVIGGAKLTEKIAAIKNFLKLDIVDKVLVGGACANVFMKAMGVDVGLSLVDDEKLGDDSYDSVTEAKHLLIKFREKIVIPDDYILSYDIDNPRLREHWVFSELGILRPYAQFDIGGDTINKYVEILSKANTIIFCGTMGFYEKIQFSFGTKAICNAISHSKAFSVAFGGDTTSAVKKFCAPGDVDHISLAGGATLEFLAKGTLPALKFLEEK